MTSYPLLDWSDAAFVTRMPQAGWLPVYIVGYFGNPHLDEFPVGPSPAPYCFKAFRSPNGRYFKMAGNNDGGRWETWPMVEPVLLRIQPPSQAIRPAQI